MADLSSQFALDMQGVAKLKYTAQQDSQAGLKQASRQFESVFLQMMLKSMREAVPQSGLLESNQTKMYSSMMDQQWAQELSKRGVGIADMMVKQLQDKGMVDAESALNGAADAQNIQGIMASDGRVIPTATPQVIPASMAMSRADEKREGIDRSVNGASSAASGNGWQAAQQRVLNTAANMLEDSDLPPHVSAFLTKMGPAAQAASEKTGIPSRLILAQAALETGWGAKEIVGSDGKQSHNLFNIKTGSSWSGRSAEVMTTEYENGTAQRIKDKFRVYDSYEEAFSDYARLLTQSPRYAGVVSASTPEAAAHQLQRSGYATDPRYGEKLVSIMSKIPETMSRIKDAISDNGYANELTNAKATASASKVASSYSLDNVPTQIF